MQKSSKIIERLDRLLYALEIVVSVGALVAACLLAIVQVLLRPFGTGLYGSNEAVVFLVIVSTFIGASITLRANGHVNVNVLAAFMPHKGKVVLAVLSGVITAAYSAFFAFVAWSNTLNPISHRNSSNVLHIPMWLVQICIPIGMTLMLIRSIQLIADAIINRNIIEDPAESLEKLLEETAGEG